MHKHQTQAPSATSKLYLKSSTSKRNLKNSTSKLYL